MKASITRAQIAEADHTPRHMRGFHANGHPERATRTNTLIAAATTLIIHAWGWHIDRTNRRHAHGRQR